MQHADFEQLIDRLEGEARTNPAGYTARVALVALAGFLILGVALGFSFLVIAAVAGLVWVAIAAGAGGGLVLLLAKLGKAVFLLAVPAWLMLRSTWTMLTSRFPAPAGRPITREEAPALFARLDDMRARMRGPRFHHVLLTDELNAAVVQHPRLGLFGGHDNYLLLGLPLMQVLTPDEAMSVVAHEYGHLAGQHGKFGAFIYRLRGAWGRMQAMSQEWTDWGSRLVAKLFAWYAPFFNAYTFVLARKNEYEADRSAVELVGRDSAVSALVRVNIAARFEDQQFWPGINRRVHHEAVPPAARSQEWARAWGNGADPGQARAWLVDALGVRTGHDDTHPALTDRVRAMGVDPAALDVPPSGTESAARAWFGNHLPAMQSALDAEWHAAVAGQWQERHAYLQSRRARLAEIEQLAEPDDEQHWERISITQELAPDTDVMPLVDALLTRHPAHASARFTRGRLRLARGDAGGIDDLEAVMRQDADATLPACGLIFEFLAAREDARAEDYRARWIARSEMEERRRAELASLDPARVTLAPAALPDDVVLAFADVVREHGKKVKRAFLLRRVIAADPDQEAWVLGIEMSWWAGDGGAQKAVNALAEATFPRAVHIVPLTHSAFGKLRKQVKALGVAPLPV